MSHRVEVGPKPHLFDARGERVKKQIGHALPDISINHITCLDLYNIEGEAEKEWCIEAFCDPVIQEVAFDESLEYDFDWYIEIGFKPGVTDNVGHSAAYALELISGKKIPVFYARGFLIKADIDRRTAEKIATECLANTLIQNYRVFDASEASGIAPYIPKVVDTHIPKVDEIDLDIPDNDLIKLSQDRTWALTLKEMKAIQSYMKNPEVIKKRIASGLGEKITDVEIEALAQTWSEHCKHKIFNADILYIENGREERISSLFKTYIKGSTDEIRRSKGKDDICISIFTDNAGVIRFTDDYHLVYKVETHNSPSALDPYGGALTGIVGVNRDPFGTGLGAKLIFNTDVFCFAEPFYSKELPPKILHPMRIFEGVREGVEHGGNKSGIPTVNGSLVFDNRYLGKPLVYCGTAGIMPKTVTGRPSHEKEILPGDKIIMSGGRIGKDGIHGATFSSEELHEASPTSAVQIGDPITQKKLTDFLLRARDMGLYRAITDNGAGGLSSSIGEMSGMSGGCLIELDKPLLKYAGLNPWEILLSEAQERMSLAVPPEKVDEFLSLSEEMGVESTVIGEFTDSGYFHCTYKGRTVAFLDMDFMHDGLPRLDLKAIWDDREIQEDTIPEPSDHDAKLREMLGRLNICSKEYVVRQYDHEVQGGSVVKPLTGAACDGPSDAGVIRPLLDVLDGVVVSNGICPRYSDIDTYHMAANALDEALRNYVCAGGDPDHWAALDNFCWCDPVQGPRNPDGTYKLAQLVRANRALYDYTIAFSCPLVSGKDSMKNDYINETLKISIPPTLLISAIGRIEDVTKAVTMDVKNPGDIIYLLGKTKNELGAGEYLASFGVVGSSVPRVDAPSALCRYKKLHETMTKGLIVSAHDCSDGGLAVALAEKAFAGGLGIEADISGIKTEGILTDTQILYSETASRIIITVSPENSESVEAAFGDDISRIGRVTSDKRLKIKGSGGIIVDSDIDVLKAAWKEPLNF
ncbi:MAG TPA: AIR synthase-related protein [Desulfomonilia bacterium]